MTFAPDSVYLVESERDPTVLLALDPRLVAGRVEWFDTVRERAFPVSATRVEGPEVVVDTPEATYRFRPLTLALYRARVQAHVLGARHFGSEAELQRFYRSLPR